MDRNIGVNTKRKGVKGSIGIPTWSKHENQPSCNTGCAKNRQPSTSTCTETTDDTSEQVSALVGASRHKLSNRRFSSTTNHSSSGSEAENEEDRNSSYRLIDVNLLSAMLSSIHQCPEGLLLL